MGPYNLLIQWITYWNLTSLQDGIFLVEFFACHPNKKCFNYINQCYWLEYHPILKISDPNRERTTHLISTSLEYYWYAQAEGLCSFSQWVCLTHSNTYTNVPFNFTVINKHKSRDPIGLNQWKTFHCFPHIFQIKLLLCTYLNSIFTWVSFTLNIILPLTLSELKPT